MAKPLEQRPSTDRLLRGSTYRGQRIAGVFKGAGPTRTILLANGKKEKVHRRDLAALARWRGTEIYRKKYKGASRTGKRVMLRKSLARQKSVHAGFLKRMQAEIDAAPAGEKRRLVRKLARIKSGKFGSPLVGKRPASALWSNERTFMMVQRTRRLKNA